MKSHGPLMILKNQIVPDTPGLLSLSRRQKRDNSLTILFVFYSNLNLFLSKMSPITHGQELNLSFSVQYKKKKSKNILF